MPKVKRSRKKRGGAWGAWMNPMYARGRRSKRRGGRSVSEIVRAVKASGRRRYGRGFFSNIGNGFKSIGNKDTWD